MANVTPFFSVILPTFNRAHLILRAVASVLNQDCEDWELIVVDDGSTDNTFGVLREIIRTNHQIRYHYGKNRGLPGARNIGIELSHGQYITFLDSDDEYLASHLSSRAEILKADQTIELLHGGAEIIGNEFVADKLDPMREISLNDCVIGGTFFVCRDLLDRLQGFKNIPYGDDSDFFERAANAKAKIVKTDLATYRYYRTEPDSLCAIVERDGIQGIENFRNGKK